MEHLHNLEPDILITDYRNGTRSPVDVAQSVLDLLIKTNPTFNAFSFWDSAETLRQAKESEVRWSEGRPSSYLDGVPISIKDLIPIRGWPTLCGSRAIDQKGPWLRDSRSVALLRRSGAVFIGKTTTPEFGHKGVTRSALHGTTVNAFDTSRSAGGSSGGSAVAVALGIGPLSLGSDGGGSIRQPASFNGIVGLKPSAGRISDESVDNNELAVVGPLGSSVTAVRRMYNLLSLQEPPMANMGNTTLPLKDFRVAVCFDLGFGSGRLDEEVAAVVRAQAELFGSPLGGQVYFDTPGLPDPAEALNIIWCANAARNARTFGGEDLARMEPTYTSMVKRGNALSESDLGMARQVKMELQASMERFHRDYDILVTPTVALAAFPADQDGPEGWSPGPGSVAWSPYTSPFNLTGQPAISVPCGRTSAGLPIGLQIVAPKWMEERILHAAFSFEQVADSHYQA